MQPDASHALCCAPGQSTQGHNDVRDVTLEFMRLADASLSEARAYMAEMTGIEVPEDHQQPFGAWVMDCLFTDASVRAGGRVGGAGGCRLHR